MQSSKLRTVHKNKNVRIISQSGQVMFSCKFCEKTFTRRDHALRHVDTIHFHAKPFACLYCSRRYTRPETRDAHLASAHSDKKPYQCAGCGSSFPSQAKLKRHHKICGDKAGSESLGYGAIRSTPSPRESR